jgi:hypothetical protein
MRIRITDSFDATTRTQSTMTVDEFEGRYHKQ